MEYFEDNQYYLTENMRLNKEDCNKERQKLHMFQVFMNQMRQGRLPPNDEGNINFPENLWMSDFESENEMEDAVMEYVFGDINHHAIDAAFMTNNVIICPLNKNVWCGESTKRLQ